MKHKKQLVIILTAILLSVAACTPLVEDTLGTEHEIDADSDITGITWLWERFDDTADINNIVVDDPMLYTFLLNADGTYTVKADCNLASGSYTLEGNSIKFEAGPTTLAECGPESLYNTFLIDLSNVVTFVIDGNKLHLNLWADAGNMVFIPTAK